MLSQNWLQKSRRYYYKDLHAEGKTNYKISKENVKEFCNFTANLVKLLWKEERYRSSKKHVAFPWLNLLFMFIFGEAYKHTTLMALQPSTHRHLRWVQWQICWLETSLNFLEIFCTGSYFSKAAQNKGLQWRLANHFDCKTCISRHLHI